MAASPETGAVNNFRKHRPQQAEESWGITKSEGLFSRRQAQTMDRPASGEDHSRELRQAAFPDSCRRPLVTALHSWKSDMKPVCFGVMHKTNSSDPFGGGMQLLFNGLGPLLATLLFPPSLFS